MIPRELLGPLDLIKAQTLYIHELTKIVMVSKDKDLIFATFSAVPLGIKRFNNS